jgi:hypothetical protein
MKIIDKIFYSRKCFQFPEKQDWPHSSWDDEIAILDSMFGMHNFFCIALLGPMDLEVEARVLTWFWIRFFGID